MAWSARSQAVLWRGRGFRGSHPIFTSHERHHLEPTRADRAPSTSCTGAAGQPDALDCPGHRWRQWIGFRSINGTVWTQPHPLRQSQSPVERRGLQPEPGALCRRGAIGDGRSGHDQPGWHDLDLRSSAADQAWTGIAWSPALSLFAAVSSDGTQRVMTSPRMASPGRCAIPPADSWIAIHWGPGWEPLSVASRDGWLHYVQRRRAHLGRW